MNINKVKQINCSIKSCKYLSLKSAECSRDKIALPLVMEPLKSQKVMLISRDPSNIANKNYTLIGWNNTFFRNHILEVFFRDYNKASAKKDKKYFNNYRDKFYQQVFWTHYSKCFPGTNKSGHKQPNKICSNMYLYDEINAVSPKYMILIGKHIIELLTNEKNIKAIERNGNNYYDNKKIKIPLICLTHPSNANNKCKNNPKYKYKDTVNLINDLMIKLI